jgi:hypothetical protein
LDCIVLVRLHYRLSALHELYLVDAFSVTDPAIKIQQPVQCGSAAEIIGGIGPDAAAVAPELVADGVGC